jgi:transposase
VAPRVSESAGERKGKNATGHGNPYIGGTLGEASVSVGRTQTFLGAKYRRQCRQMPKKKAQGAIMRTQLITAHALLPDPEAEYIELGTDYYEQKADTRRRACGHVRGLERIGYKATIEAIDPGTGELSHSRLTARARPAGAPRRKPTAVCAVGSKDMPG